MTNKRGWVKNLIASLVMIPAINLAVSKPVYAVTCDSQYGGGEKCVYNKSFKITKRVRIYKEGMDEGEGWKDSVTVSEGKRDRVQFRITVENTGEIETDDMKITDNLPDNMDQIDKDGDWTWDNFEPGDKHTVILKVKIESDAFDKDHTFERCLVNKAKVTRNGEFEGSDTATVCYGKDVDDDDDEVKELPKTGAENYVVAALGLGAVAAGRVLGKKRNSIK